MTLKRLSAVLLVLVGAVTVCAAAYAAQNKPSIILDLTLPNGATPRLRILEGNTGTVSIEGVGKYGFVPTIKGSTVVVDVLDLNRATSERLARVEAVADGDEVHTQTSPQFGIRVVSIIAP